MPFGDKLAALFGSRRFYGAVTAILVVVFNEVLGLPESQAQVIAGVLSAWILGDSINKTS